jgi:hypothetical protein
LSICQPQGLKFHRLDADAEHKEALGNTGVPTG